MFDSWRHVRGDALFMCDMTHSHVYLSYKICCITEYVDETHKNVKMSYNINILCVTWRILMYIWMHVLYNIFTCMYVSSTYSCVCTGWRRVTGRLIFIGHFLQKSPIISGSFARKACNLKHPMGLRHPVCVYNICTFKYDSSTYLYVCATYLHVYMFSYSTTYS